MLTRGAGAGRSALPRGGPECGVPIEALAPPGGAKGLCRPTGKPDADAAAPLSGAGALAGAREFGALWLPPKSLRGARAAGALRSGASALLAAGGRNLAGAGASRAGGAFLPHDGAGLCVSAGARPGLPP